MKISFEDPIDSDVSSTGRSEQQTLFCTGVVCKFRR